MPHSLQRHTAFKSVHIVSIIVLSFIISFISPAGKANATACADAFCVTAQAQSVNTHVVKTPMSLNTSVINTGAAISNAIIDIEIYDASHRRVHQSFVEQQYLPTNQTRTVPITWTPENTGTYTVKVGVFKQWWSGLYYWTDTAGSISVTEASAPVQTTAQPTSIGESSITSQPAAVQATSLNVWWPSANATLKGVQPFKVLAENMPIHDYTMYWQVDGGQLNKMDNSFVDYPHKESLVDISGWNWKGKGPYVLTFVVKNSFNQTVGTKQVSIYTDADSTVQTAPAPTVSVQPTVVPVTTVTVSKALSNLTLYIDPNNPAKQQADQWRANRPADALQMDKIAGQSQARWFGGWNSNIYEDVRSAVAAANAAGGVPTLIAYNIPQRDCGGYSAGGAGSDSSYKNWIDAFANAIGSGRAIVIVEPDGLAHMDCLSDTDKNRRMSLVKYAVEAFKSKPNTYVYIDAGHAQWVSADEMGARLSKAGIATANGFALNVSNFIATSDNIAYGEQLSKRVNNKHFVIDTARNGLGPTADKQWCNPSGRALGEKPTVTHQHSLVDALLWLKTPGESDGNCNGGPSAGQWWGEYALGLAQRANW